MAPTMPSFSNVDILGYIGNDVELNRGPKSNYLNLSVAVTRAFQVKEEWKTETSWFKVMFFGKYAEYAVNRVAKGDLIHVFGELATNSFTDKNRIKRSEMYVLGKKLIPINSKKKSNEYAELEPEDEIMQPFY
jgi:single-strand DNA-binding protein